MKKPIPKEKFGYPRNHDYADTQFSNFAIEYLHEREKVRETVFACSYWVHVESFKQKQYGQNFGTLSIKVKKETEAQQSLMALYFFLSAYALKILSHEYCERSIHLLI